MANGAPEIRSGLAILPFEEEPAFAAWLAAQPRDSKGLWLRIFKTHVAHAGITKAAAIDAMPCHGWIDGQLGRYDTDSFLVRVTPRRHASIWSAVNRARAIELIAAGRMAPAGLAAIEAARADGRWDAAYAPASRAEVPEDLQAALDAAPDAAAFFTTLTGANRYAILHRIATARKPETRARRIAGFVAMLSRGETIHG